MGADVWGLAEHAVFYVAGYAAVVEEGCVCRAGAGAAWRDYKTGRTSITYIVATTDITVRYRTSITISPIQSLRTSRTNTPGIIRIRHQIINTSPTHIRTGTRRTVHNRAVDACVVRV